MWSDLCWWCGVGLRRRVSTRSDTASDPTGRRIDAWCRDAIAIVDRRESVLQLRLRKRRKITSAEGTCAGRPHRRTYRRWIERGWIARQRIDLRYCSQIGPRYVNCWIRLKIWLYAWDSKRRRATRGNARRETVVSGQIWCLDTRLQKDGLTNE